MRVGTRITVATSLVVALSLAFIGIVDLRHGARESRRTYERETKMVAKVLRTSLEISGIEASLGQAQELSRELVQGEPGWMVTIFSAAVSPLPATPSPAATSPSVAQRRRLRAMVDQRLPSISTTSDTRFIYTLPLRVANPKAAERFDVGGIIEVSRDTSELNKTQSAARWRAITFGFIVAGLVFVTVTLFTRGLVTRPLKKLLAGIGDVAEGDLSHVVLSEHENEIGKLATRFNEMTYSLRESRAETKRQNHARSELEEQLFQTEKLATIGQLAAEIAHEVGTPLNVIAGRAKTLGKKSHEVAAVEKNAAIIAEQTQRITRIIQRLLDFARRKVGDTEPERVNLNEITFTTMEFLEGRLRDANVHHSLAREENLPPVRGYPDQLQQVLLNLLINAIEAMPDGGTLKVETSHATVRRPGLEEAAAEAVVVVRVKDSGPGIPAELHERIFEPFYTSKERDGGTGLGLAVSHGIVKEHDGWVDVDSGPGRGTQFSLFFPVASSKDRRDAGRENCSAERELAVEL